MSTTVYEKIWYLPTYLKNKTDTGCTLLGHVYTIRRSDMGNYNLHNRVDAWHFDNDDELADFIQSKKARELPSEADGQPRFVPNFVKNKLAKLKAQSQAIQHVRKDEYEQ